MIKSGLGAQMVCVTIVGCVCVCVCVVCVLGALVESLTGKIQAVKSHKDQSPDQECQGLHH